MYTVTVYRCQIFKFKQTTVYLNMRTTGTVHYCTYQKELEAGKETLLRFSTASSCFSTRASRSVSLKVVAVVLLLLLLLGITLQKVVNLNSCNSSSRWRIYSTMPSVKYHLVTCCSLSSNSLLVS